MVLGLLSVRVQALFSPKSKNGKVNVVCLQVTACPVLWSLSLALSNNVLSSGHLDTRLTLALETLRHGTESYM